MTKQQLLEYYLNTYGTSPDYPFDEDFETAVHQNGKNFKIKSRLNLVVRLKEATVV